MKDSELFEHYKHIGNVIAMAFPQFVEVIIHDLRQPQTSIIAIFNSQITGRKVGDGSTNLGYQRLEGTVPDELINYKNEAPDGRPLKSTSIAIRNENNDLIGSFCLNIDLSFFSQMGDFITQLTQAQVTPLIHKKETFFYKSPKEEVQKQINRCIAEKQLIGKQLTKQDKMMLIKQLYYSGALNARGSVATVSNVLQLTRQTIYNYLNKVKRDSLQEERSDSLSEGVSINDIRDARYRIKSYIKPTSVVRVQWLEQHLNTKSPIYFKLENQQITGSFKPRGALNALLSLSGAKKKKGIIARSSGNFAQAVAYGSHQLGLKATVVMPVTAPQIKVDGAKKYGATVIQTGTTHQEGTQKVSSLVHEKGYTCLHGFDSPSVIAGQGTIGLEIVEKIPDIGTLICPIGGGGLLSGCSIALKDHNVETTIIAAEPENANDFYKSFKAGIRKEISPPHSQADGLLTTQVGCHNWPILKNNVDNVVQVSEEEISKTMTLVKTSMNMMIEPSSAVGVAALIKSHQEYQTKGPIVCVISGGNIDV